MSVNFIILAKIFARGFGFALTALSTFGGVSERPVRSAYHALTKLSADLNRTAMYFRNINSSPSDLTVDETQKHAGLYFKRS